MASTLCIFPKNGLHHLPKLLKLAYGFAPASTIGPLGTTTLISNVVMAPLILRETFRLQGLIGVLFAVFGASIVVFSSKSEELAVSVYERPL